MPSQFAAQTMPLGQLFASLHTINTPTYQRPFSWEQREAGRLLDDLTAAMEGNGDGSEIDGLAVQVVAGVVKMMHGDG